MEMNLAYLFNLGKNYMSYNILGSKPETNSEGERGYRFAVWAPNAKKFVSLVISMNGKKIAISWNRMEQPGFGLDLFLT